MHTTLPSAAFQLAEEAARDATERARRVMSKGEEKQRQWYVVHNAAGNDKRALDTLKRSEFEVYYPNEATLKIVPRNKLSQKQRLSPMPRYEPAFKPLFPRYFFIHFDLDRGDWHDVFKLAGLHGIIVADGSSHPVPAPVDNAVIDNMKAEEIDCSIPGALLAEKFAIRLGQAVRITSGPLAKFTAVVESLPKGPINGLDESARLRLLVSLFGRKSVVEMALADIEKL